MYCCIFPAVQSIYSLPCICWKERRLYDGSGLVAISICQTASCSITPPRMHNKALVDFTTSICSKHFLSLVCSERKMDNVDCLSLVCYVSQDRQLQNFEMSSFLSTIWGISSSCLNFVIYSVSKNLWTNRITTCIVDANIFETIHYGE